MNKQIEKCMDNLKNKFEEAMPEYKVSAIIDYNNKEVIIVCGDKDGRKLIPGVIFKVNKRTGMAERFNPMSDIKGYGEAARTRCKKYS